MCVLDALAPYIQKSLVACSIIVIIIPSYADVSECYFQLDKIWGVELNLMFSMLASIQGYE